MGRPPCCDKANVKRGLWTPEEDAKILAYVANHGTGNWTLVPKKAGLNRCGKSCRLRWTNYLRPDLKHDSFSPQEEDLIVDLHKAIGSRWSLIAKRLPGRTDNDVKNYWNTKLKKKLMKMGIDPITHKPFSQIFSDYNSVSCITQTRSQSQPLPDTQQLPIPMMPMPMFGHFHHHLDEVSPESSCSSSSSSMTNLQQRSVQITGIPNNSDATLQCEVFKVGSDKAVETSSFVKAILDRDTELQLDLLALNEFLDY